MEEKRDNPSWLNAYRDAYRLAVGEEPPVIQRRGSWWAMLRRGYTQKYRRADLEAATKRLLARANPSPSKDNIT